MDEKTDREVLRVALGILFRSRVVQTIIAAAIVGVCATLGIKDLLPGMHSNTVDHPSDRTVAVHFQPFQGFPIRVGNTELVCVTLADSLGNWKFSCVK